MCALILLNVIADIMWKSHIFSFQLCDLFICFAVYCEFCVLIGNVINSNFFNVIHTFHVLVVNILSNICTLL